MTVYIYITLDKLGNYIVEIYIEYILFIIFILFI